METCEKFRRHNLKRICDTANVINGYKYWFDKLLAYCLNIFKYEGLPDSLPAKEVESNLILTGHCVCFRNRGEVITAYTQLYGFDKYYNPTHAVYAQPKILSKNLNFASDEVCIIYNCDLENQVLGENIDGSLYEYISRYARFLADIESTISIAVVNKRMPFMPVSDDNTVRQNVKEFFNKITFGQRTIVTDNSIHSLLKTIDLDNFKNPDKILDLWLARDKILECFLREIGIKFHQSKKAQENVEETKVNDSLYLINIDDMLSKRQEDFSYFNELFGYNVKVKINDRFMEGVSDNVSE